MSAGVVVAHGAVLTLWASTAATFIGLGTALHRILRGPASAEPPCLFVALWLGIAGSILLLQGWYLLAPVSGGTLALILALGAVGWTLRLRRASRRRAPTPAGGRRVTRWAFMVVAVLWVANRCLAPLRAYDTGVYMIPASEWARAFAAVPGLAALHGRLGFNSANVLLAALLEAGPWPHAAPHLIGGFFVCTLLARSVSRLGRRFDDAHQAALTAFDLALLPAAVAMTLDDQLVPGLSADVPATAAQLAFASLLLERAYRARDGDGGIDHTVGAGAALLAAITFKITVIAFALVGIALLLRIPGDEGVRRAERRRLLWSSGTAAALLIGGWALLGAISSGYLLYPASVLPLPVPWRVPAEQALAEGAWVRHFARTWYDTDLANSGQVAAYAWGRFHWLGPWAAALARGKDAGLVSLGLWGALGLGAAAALRRRRWPIGGGPMMALALAGLGFWFCTAPRPSFAVAPAWLACAGSLVWLTSGMASRHAATVTGATVCGLTALVMAAAVQGYFPGQVRSADAWRWTLLVDADGEHWFREMEGSTETYRTESGLLVYRPTVRGLCLRAPLPCSPHPAPNLRARRPGELGRGFEVVGPWQPERWPNSGGFLPAWRAQRGAP